MLGFAALSQSPLSTLPLVRVTLSGITGTTGLGTATTTAAGNTTATGLVGTSALGNVSIALDQVGITGVTGTSQLGQIIYNNSVTVSGIFATGYVGTVYLWNQIDDNQTANWANIDDSNTTNWTVISTSQTPNWTGIII